MFRNLNLTRVFVNPKTPPNKHFPSLKDPLRVVRDRKIPPINKDRENVNRRWQSTLNWMKLTDRTSRKWSSLCLSGAINCRSRLGRVPSLPFTSGNVTNTATSRQHWPQAKNKSHQHAHVHTLHPSIAFLPFLSFFFFSFSPFANRGSRRSPTNWNEQPRSTRSFPPLNSSWPAYLAEISSNRLDHSKTTPRQFPSNTCILCFFAGLIARRGCDWFFFSNLFQLYFF